ncbi:uncharacterized protein LOC105182756 isoform X2 [Harpegnathos saltator]|uniref:uncharacterized protein LOC105182756 isoform X2 n=1 Tax=Harpegnathos saltator TaxID=610380 RepID=UPI000948E429|nr:uncharacterized protein LOC105182756 isoform X2 [Harpegnathos saltator]
MRRVGPTMERFAEFLCFCRRMGSGYYDIASSTSPSSASSAHVEPAAAVGTDPSSSAQNAKVESWQQWWRNECQRNSCWVLLYRILSNDIVYKGIRFFLMGHIIFMTILTLQLRGLTVGTAIVMLLALWYTCNPILHEDFNIEIFLRFKQIVNEVLHNMGRLRDKQPGLFCIATCSVSVIILVLDHMTNGMLLKYMIFMIIILVPSMALCISPTKISACPPPSNRRESDSEIEEFLPAATETNIQILTEAGDVGEYSATSTTALAKTSKENEEQEFLNDGDLAGRKMPSHEDGSSDGLELSDLELSEKSSTSSGTGQSDSEFEIIDRQEIGKLCTSQNST